MRTHDCLCTLRVPDCTYTHTCTQSSTSSSRKRGSSPGVAVVPQLAPAFFTQKDVAGIDAECLNAGFSTEGLQVRAFRPSIDASDRYTHLHYLTHALSHCIFRRRMYSMVAVRDRRKVVLQKLPCLIRCISDPLQSYIICLRMSAVLLIMSLHTVVCEQG
jgi:hypothetical protein